MHLITSHHGRCRPFAPVIEDPSPVSVTLQFDGYELNAGSDTRLEQIGSGVAERFWILVRRYGWWGIAWLESSMPLADWARSDEEQRIAQEDETETSSKEVA